MSTLAKTVEESLPDMKASDSVATVAQAQPSFDRIPVKVSAVLGKTRIDLATLREFGPGSVIELNRKVGEPIDLYVNDRLIARGELVMTDGALGVTMTEIVRDEDA